MRLLRSRIHFKKATSRLRKPHFRYLASLGDRLGLILRSIWALECHMPVGPHWLVMWGMVRFELKLIDLVDYLGDIKCFVDAPSQPEVNMFS